MTLTPEQRALRARIAAHARHARTDGREATRAARDAFLARFEKEADPDNVLPAAERKRRAEQLRRAHMAKLALASSRARQKKAA